MKHFIAHRASNRWACSPWDRSDDVYGPVITIYRGIAFVWQSYFGDHRVYSIIDGDVLDDVVVRRGLLLPRDRTLRSAKLNKKAWARYLIEQAPGVLLLTTEEAARSVDGVPWAIHRIDDRGARDAAERAYMREHGTCSINFTKIFSQMGR